MMMINQWDDEFAQGESVERYITLATEIGDLLDLSAITMSGILRRGMGTDEVIIPWQFTLSADPVTNQLNRAMHATLTADVTATMGTGSWSNIVFATGPDWGPVRLFTGVIRVERGLI